jgi:alginate O-acetyltransferase complex protein AlgI
MFLIIGVWHGANWKYILYGLWNGGVIALGILMEPLSTQILKKLHIRPDNLVWRLFQMLRTLIICTLGRYLIRSDGIKAGWAMLKRTFGNLNIGAFANGAFLKMGLDGKELLLTAVCVLILLIAGILQEKGHKLREELGQKSVLIQGFITVCAIFAILIFGIYGAGYDKAAFLYGQF